MTQWQVTSPDFRCHPCIKLHTEFSEPTVSVTVVKLFTCFLSSQLGYRAVQVSFSADTRSVHGCLPDVRQVHNLLRVIM